MTRFGRMPTIDEFVIVHVFLRFLNKIIGPSYTYCPVTVCIYFHSLLYHYMPLIKQVSCFYASGRRKATLLKKVQMPIQYSVSDFTHCKSFRGV